MARVSGAVAASAKRWQAFARSLKSSGVLGFGRNNGAHSVSFERERCRVSQPPTPNGSLSAIPDMWDCAGRESSVPVVALASANARLQLLKPPQALRAGNRGHWWFGPFPALVVA